MLLTGLVSFPLADVSWRYLEAPLLAWGHRARVADGLKTRVAPLLWWRSNP
jgi:peptidoglycan/LPS O-acetylase OafA/YrhL